MILVVTNDETLKSNSSSRKPFRSAARRAGRRPAAISGYRRINAMATVAGMPQA
jgi:hypothetical protein